MVARAGGASWWLAEGPTNPPTEYSYAVVGALSGLSLATTSLALGGGMGEGGAVLTHSGGAFGTVLGGMTELAIRGKTEGDLPFRGLGYGAGIGVVLAGALATQLEVEPSRVLAVNLGAGLGGLAGAAAWAHSFRERTKAGNRTFVISTMAATVAGGLAAWLWTGSKASPVRASNTFVAPLCRRDRLKSFRGWPGARPRCSAWG